jgi:hypothetical protein
MKESVTAAGKAYAVFNLVEKLLFCARGLHCTHLLLYAFQGKKNR